MSGPRERIAAIDVGSNTILLTVAEHDPDVGLVVVEQGEDQPRLGAGLSASGRLSDDAMDRALESLARMRDLCRRLGVKRLAAVATAAVREARNGDEFVERARAMGIPLRTISAETEAALSYRSAAHHFPTGEPTIVADTGGGSLELIGARNGRVRLSRSLPLGAVRLTELQEPVAQLRERIRRAIQEALARPEWLGSRLIGSGGTFATMAAMALARKGVPGRPVHGTEVSRDELRQMLDGLVRMSPEERRQVPGLKPERSDIIVAGLMVVDQLLDWLETSKVTVSGFGLRDGLLLEMVGLE